MTAPQADDSAALLRVEHNETYLITTTVEEGVV